MEEKIFLVTEKAERFEDMVKFLEEAIHAKSGEDQKYKYLFKLKIIK